MGKTGGSSSWLLLVKKAFRSPSKDNEKRISRRREDTEQEEEEEKKRGKRRWIFRKQPPIHETTTIHHIRVSNTNKGNNCPKYESSEFEKRPTKIAMAMASAAAATAQAAVEIIRLTRPALLARERNAAIVIQTAFRGFLARKALRAMEGVVKLQALVRGHNVRRRAKMTLRCMQSLVRVQTQVCDRRRLLSCEGSLNSFFSDSNSSHRRSTSRTDFRACALQRERVLANAFSQQMWSPSKEKNTNKNEEIGQHDPRLYYHQEHNRRASFDQPRRDPTIRTLEIDTNYPNQTTKLQNQHKLYHPTTPQHNKIINPVTLHYSAETPDSLVSTKTSPVMMIPSYMAATASAKARSQTPDREKQQHHSTAKKRLSFSPVADSNNVHRGYSSKNRMRVVNSEFI